MRLICPNCDAEYEVETSLIPEGGRDVQCSNCGHTWFQMAPGDVTEPVEETLLFDPPPALSSAVEEQPAEPEAEKAPEPPALTEPDAAAARPRGLDESLRAVLREEAEREVAARRSEAPPQPIETQEEMALAETPPSLASSGAEGPPAPERAAARRDLFPDVEEINSTLRPADGSVPDAAVVVAAPVPRGAFRTGFVLMLLIAAAVVALYVMAPRLAQHLPAAAPMLDSFVATVDTARLFLDGLMKSAIGAINGKAPS